jgi:hypothetical protein
MVGPLKKTETTSLYVVTTEVKDASPLPKTEAAVELWLIKWGHQKKAEKR